MPGKIVTKPREIAAAKVSNFIYYVQAKEDKRSKLCLDKHISDESRYILIDDSFWIIEWVAFVGAIYVIGIFCCKKWLERVSGLKWFYQAKTACCDISINIDVIEPIKLTRYADQGDIETTDYGNCHLSGNHLPVAIMVNDAEVVESWFTFKWCRCRSCCC